MTPPWLPITHGRATAWGALWSLLPLTFPPLRWVLQPYWPSCCSAIQQAPNCGASTCCSLHSCHSHPCSTVTPQTPDLKVPGPHPLTELYFLQSSYHHLILDYLFVFCVVMYLSSTSPARPVWGRHIAGPQQFFVQRMTGRSTLLNRNTANAFMKWGSDKVEWKLWSMVPLWLL